MANERHKNVWVIDTAGAALVTEELTDIQSVRWVGGTTAGHHATIVDVNGDVVWDSVADAANFVDESVGIDIRLEDGFAVTVLQSGTLYIYIRARV